MSPNLNLNSNMKLSVNLYDNQTNNNFALATASSRHDGMIKDNIKRVAINAFVCVLLNQPMANVKPFMQQSLSPLSQDQLFELVCIKSKTKYRYVLIGSINFILLFRKISTHFDVTHRQLQIKLNQFTNVCTFL